MIKVDKLLLENKTDIYIDSIKEFIHQPSIQEIAYTIQGEKKFFEILNEICKTIIDKNFIKKEIKISDEELKNITSFDYFIGLMVKNNYLFIYIKALLKLFFPEHICYLNSKQEDNKFLIFLEMLPKNNTNNKKLFIIDKNNYDEIIEYIKIICCISSEEKNKNKNEFKPINEKAQKIMEKMLENRKKIQEIKEKENKEEYFLAKILNLLRGTGNFTNIELQNMSIYQLIQTFKRYQLFYTEFKQNIFQANGFEIKEFIDWMEKI